MHVLEIRGLAVNEGGFQMSPAKLAETILFWVYMHLVLAFKEF